MPRRLTCFHGKCTQGPPIPRDRRSTQRCSLGGAVPSQDVHSQRMVPRPWPWPRGAGHSGDSTHRGDIRFAHIHTPALPSCSQIACCIDVDKVDVDKALCERVQVHCMSAPCLRLSIVRTSPAPSCTCPAHTCAQALFARGCHASFVCRAPAPSAGALAPKTH